MGVAPPLMRGVPPCIKTGNFPSLQSVTKGRYIFHFSKKIFAYIKSSVKIHSMKKNFDQIFSTIEIDPVTDRYHITIPEEIINEYDWYEDLKLKWNIDNNGDIFITEEESD
tara:strand:- start:70 stop:402 length:333 start_codon:yes stop_codon:yes gene_type:complete